MQVVALNERTHLEQEHLYYESKATFLLTSRQKGSSLLCKLCLQGTTTALHKNIKGYRFVISEQSNRNSVPRTLLERLHFQFPFYCFFLIPSSYLNTVVKNDLNFLAVSFSSEVCDAYLFISFSFHERNSGRSCQIASFSATLCDV